MCDEGSNSGVLGIMGRGGAARREDEGGVGDEWSSSGECGSIVRGERGIDLAG